MTIPATDTTDELTISLNAPTDQEVLDALFWLYADGDEGLVLENGILKAAPDLHLFAGEVFAQGDSLQREFLGVPSRYDSPTLYVYSMMNLSRAWQTEVDFAHSSRAAISGSVGVHAVNRPWEDGLLHADTNAVDSVLVTPRWIKNTYSNSVSTMSDRLTGLMWSYDAEVHNRSGHYNSFLYCRNLSYAGYSDWFLPDVNQLAGVSRFRHLFANVVSSRYWSSTTWIHAPSVAYFVDMSTGGINGADGFMYAYWRWPCRYAK